MSKYRNNFILKGGLLVASLVGLSNRNTIDLDALITGIGFNESNIIKLFQDVSTIDVGDNVLFKIKKVQPIRENDDYGGYRISVDAKYFDAETPIKFDFSTGDIVTPEPIEYNYQTLFRAESIKIRSYNRETILAEKIQTIFARGAATTRMRDYYDVWVITKVYSELIESDQLIDAITRTSKNRDTNQIYNGWHEKLIALEEDDNLPELWDRFTNSNQYAREVKFAMTISQIAEIMAQYENRMGEQ